MLPNKQLHCCQTPPCSVLWNSSGRTLPFKLYAIIFTYMYYVVMCALCVLWRHIYWNICICIYFIFFEKLCYQTPLASLSVTSSSGDSKRQRASHSSLKRELLEIKKKKLSLDTIIVGWRVWKRMDDEEETYRLWKIRKTIMQVLHGGLLSLLSSLA